MMAIDRAENANGGEDEGGARRKRFDLLYVAYLSSLLKSLLLFAVTMMYVIVFIIRKTMYDDTKSKAQATTSAPF